MLIEKRKFDGGMDGDTNPRELPDNVMLNLMNGRVGVTEYGRDKRVESVPGTTRITQSVMPIYGTSMCLGSCVDEARNRIFFFIWNSFGDHSIFCYDIGALTMYGVLYDSQVTGGLNFSKSYRIDRNCKVVGDLLYWTDNLNPPRRINTEAAIKLNTPSYVTTVTAYTFPLSQSVISWIRRPYGLPTVTTKGVGGVATNFIKSFSGQFASRLIYRDGEQSVLSVPSAMINYNLDTDTYDLVQVLFPLVETFDQDVQIIQLAVRYGNNPDYFVVKEWNKANATDLAEIIAHNNGITNLTFNFYNDRTGVPVGEADSVKPDDSIGITVKTIEFASNRMFHANYVKGYNVPTSTSLASALVTGSGATGYTRVWKAYSTYQLAIQFRDKSKRKCSVITNSSLIVTIPDRNIAYSSYVTGINWSVSNALATTEIPDWAYYYDILITKNLRTRNFVTGNGFPIQYAKKQPDGTYTYQNTYDAFVNGISLNTTLMNSDGIGYLFTEGSGDIARIYLASTSTVYSLNVIAQVAQNIIIQPQDIGNLSGVGVRYEIYTPYQQSENETFYTTGESFTITNPTTSGRVYSTTSGIINGDVYRWFDQNLEFMSPNNKVKWDSWTNIYGETNQQSLLGQVSKINFLQWSNAKIVGAQTNGLSTFDSLDEKSLPLEDGSIQKLQLANKVSDQGQGNIMLAICSTEIASIYLGATEVFGSSKTVYVAQSTDVAGSANTLTGSLGTANPESVVAYLGLVFGYDVNNGCWWQYSQAGLEPISRYKMTRFFQRYSKDYLAASPGNLDNINGFHHIPSGIDAFHKELVCGMPGLIYSNYANTLPSYSSVPSYATSIINRFDIYDQLAKDMCFSFEENIWSKNFNYGCEWFETVENTMFGWKNGIMWSFNTNTTQWNTFFGTQYPVRICITGNINSSMMKVLNNISIEGDGTIPNYVVALTAVPNQQITDLANTDTVNGESVWVVNEGVAERPFLADRLSPNVSGTADEKLFMGDPLRDFSIFVMCEWQKYDSLLYINFINLGYSESKGMSNLVNVINK